VDHVLGFAGQIDPRNHTKVRRIENEKWQMENGKSNIQPLTKPSTKLNHA